MTALLPPDCVGAMVLRLGLTTDGAYAQADGSGATANICAELAHDGLLRKAERVQHIQIWRTTEAGAQAIGAAVAMVDGRSSIN